jgi:hypothetical protein
MLIDLLEISDLIIPDENNAEIVYLEEYFTEKISH